MADSAIGTTLVFTTSSYTLNVLSATPSENAVNALPITTLATTGFREYIPGTIKEAGEMEIVALHDPDLEPPIGTVDTMTLTWPLPSGQAVAGTLAGTGFVQSFQVQELNSEDDAPMTINISWKWDGLTGPTLTASS